MFVIVWTMAIAGLHMAPCSLAAAGPAAAGDAEAASERYRGRLTIGVATDGSAAQVRQLLERMDKLGAEVDKVAIRRPSLDDVFLALTSEGDAR